jgi:hypothetical protein
MATRVAIAGIKAGFSWSTDKDTNLAGGIVANSGGFSFTKSYASTVLADATAATTIDVVSKFYADEFTLAPGAVKSYDLNGDATLKDCFGEVITLNKVRYMYVELVYVAGASGTDSSGITIGGGTFASIFSSFMGITPAAIETTKSPTILVQAGGCFQLCSGKGLGYAITSSTVGDTITITNNAQGSATTGIASVRVCFAGV